MEQWVVGNVIFNNHRDMQEWKELKKLRKELLKRAVKRGKRGKTIRSKNR
jgi:hypothetical protein